MPILARSDDVEMAADLAGRQLVGYTETSITDESTLRKEVAATRERGYAVNPGGWWRDHVSTVAAAIPAESGKPIAAIVVSVPTIRFDRSAAARFGEAAVRAAESITQALKPRANRP